MEGFAEGAHVVSVQELGAGDEFVTEDGEHGRVFSPLGVGEGDLARLAVVTDRIPFLRYVDWGAETRVAVRARAPAPPAED